MEARMKEIRERLQKASPGPWKVVSGLFPDESDGKSVAYEIEMPEPVISAGNKHFIENAPDDIRYLLDELKKAREEIGELEADLKANAAMLAKQTDLARQAEIEREEARRFERDESRRRQEMYAALVAEYAKALDSRLSSGLSEDEE